MSMVEEILANLYRIKLPLPKSPLKEVNSYVIKGLERNLIIDTGWNREECMNVMQARLKELRVDLNCTDFFITHLHADHLGLVSNLATDNSTIYFNQQEACKVNVGFRWDDKVNFARINGFPESELQKVLHNHPGYKYNSKGSMTFNVLKEDDTINIGNYIWRCVETPGHTNGHMCLYEPNKKVIVSGDHILNDITPTISLWSNEGNPLKEYLGSLDKIYKLDIKLVLPGHRNIFMNCKERIQELQHHHQERADEVLSILKKDIKNAYQIASQMSWDIDCISWDLFPIIQKWFAVGEAIAHLKYLEEEGRVQREMLEQNIMFSLRRH
jgi:glyoxylase-like metal-dependent hydrolase (beta-lactamase superfamily II)